MSIFDEIRQAAPWAKDFTDEEILDAGSQLTGLGVRDVAKGLGVNVNDKRNPISAGLSSGLDDLQGLVYSGGAAAADALGMNGARDWANRRAKINDVESQMNGRPDLERIEDQSWSSAPSYAAYQVAKQIPNVVGGIAAGALVPEVAVPAALARGAAFMPRALGGGGMAGRLAEAGGEFAAKRAAYDAAINGGETFARQLTGGAAFNYGQGVGSLYQEAAAAGDPDAGIKSLVGGLPYAVTETLPEAMLVGRFKNGSGFSGNFLERAGKSALIQAPAGSASELAQTGMEMAYGPERTDAQARSQYLNAGVAGGLVEGLMGGFGGMFSRRLRPSSNLLSGETPQEDQIVVNQGANVATQDWINQLTGVNRPKPVNNAATFNAALDAPTGQIGFDPVTGQERVLTGADNIPKLAQQAPVNQEQAQLEQIQQLVVPKYGSIVPIMGTDGPVGFNFMGKEYATEDQAFKKMVSVFNQEAKKPEFVLQAEQALVDANRQLLSDTDGNPGPHLTMSQVNTYANQIGLGVATSPQNVVERLDRRLAELENKKGKGALATKELFTLWRAQLTGENVSQNVQTAPAVQNQQQQGVQNGLQTQEIQNPAQAQVTNEATAQQLAPEAAQAPAAETTQAVQPTNAVAQAEARAREAWDEETIEGDPKFDDLSPEAKQEWAVSVLKGENSAELMDNIIKRAAPIENMDSATKADVVRGLFAKVFGERDAEIMQLAVQKDMTQDEIAKQFGMSRANVQKILKRANPDNLQRLLAEAKAIGMSEEDLRTAMASETQETTDASELEDGYNEADKDTTGLAEESDFAGAAADLVGDTQGVLDNNDVFGSENGATPSMKIRKSANDAEINIAARTMGEKFIEAAEAGDVEAIANVEKEFAKLEAQLKELYKEKAAAKTKEAREAVDAKIEQISARFVSNGQATPSFRTVPEAVSLKALMSVPAIAKGVEQLKSSGLGDLVNKVSMWTVYASNNKGEGAYVTEDEHGYIVAFNIKALDAEGARADHYVRHELGHVLDDALNGRTYSKAKELSIRMMNGKPSFLGAVARELHSLYQKGDQMWREYFAYPFDTSHFVLEEGQKVTASDMAVETFAQLVSAYTDPQMGVQLKADAPLASAFMEKVLNEHRSERTTAEATGRNAPDGSRRASAGVQKNPDNANDGKARVYASAKRGNSQQSNSGAAQTRQGTVEKRIAQLPSPVRGPVQQLFDNFFNAVKKGVYGFAFTKDLVDMAAKALPSSVDYVKLMERKGAVARAHENAVDNIIRDYEALDAHERGIGAGSVNRFIHDSTISGKWGYKIKQDSNIVLDPELKARFENFSGPAKEVIKSVFKHGYDTLQQKKQLVRAEINSEFDDILNNVTEVKERRELEAQRRAKLKQFDSLLSIEANKPYAPLKRFGNYVVVGMSKEYLDAKNKEDAAAMAKMQSDENHYYVQFADTYGEASQIRDDIAGNYAYAERFEKNKAREALYGGQEVFTAFQKLKSMVVEQFGDDEADNKSLKAINRMVSDLYLSSLAESSARKSETRRRKVAGADLDMMRAFSTQGRADAHFIGSLLYSAEVNKSLEAMMTESGKTAPGRDERARLMNEFLLRHAGSMDYKPSRVQDAIQRATSLYMLAFSPSYYLQNLTQTHMMSLPVMAGRHGYAASAGALNAAYGDLSPMLKGSGMARRMNFENAPENVRSVVEELVKRGVLDIGMDQDLGSFRSGGEGAVSRFNNKLDRFLRGLPQKVEAINRVSTAIAAYNLELKRNKGDAQAAIDYAEKIINTTHGDYSGFNAPRFINQVTGGKVLFQFRKFQIIQLSLMTRLFNDAFRNSSPDERWAAKKALGYLVAQTGMVGGVMGLPGFTAAAWLLGLFGDDDEPDNPELTMRKMIGDKDMANLFLKGAPTLVGIDLSGKLGMGQMLSILPFADVDLSSRSGYEKALTAATGPFFGGVMPRMADAMDYLSKGDYFKSIETALPIGVGNALKAYRVASEGMTNRNNDVVMGAEEFNFAQSFAMAIGIPLIEVNHKNFVQKAQLQFDQYFQDEAANIKHRYTAALRDGESTAELVKDWNDLQAARVRNGYTRQNMSELLKASKMQVKREAGATGGVLTTKANKGFVTNTAGL